MLTGRLHTHTSARLSMSRTRQAFFPARLPLYSSCRIRPAMAINAVVISRSDPGAVPGASTTCPCEPACTSLRGHLMGAN